LVLPHELESVTPQLWFSNRISLASICFGHPLLKHFVKVAVFRRPAFVQFI